MGAAEEQRGASEQAPGGTVDQSTPSSPRWAGTPICPSSASAARSPNSAAGTTPASRLGVRKASLVHDWIARYPDFPQPVARLKAAHGWAWPDVRGVRTSRPGQLQEG